MGGRETLPFGREISSPAQIPPWIKPYIYVYIYTYAPARIYTPMIASRFSRSPININSEKKKYIMLLTLLSFYLLIVSFDPDGPLFIPINTQRTINCSSTEGAIYRWFVILRNSIEFGASAEQGTVERFGITGIFMPPSLQLTVNTPNTSVVGLRCINVVRDNVGQIIRGSEADINLTLYGKYLVLH